MCNTVLSKDTFEDTKGCAEFIESHFSNEDSYKPHFEGVSRCMYFDCIAIDADVTEQDLIKWCQREFEFRIRIDNSNPTVNFDQL